MTAISGTAPTSPKSGFCWKRRTRPPRYLPATQESKQARADDAAVDQRGDQRREATMKADFAVLKVFPAAKIIRHMKIRSRSTWTPSSA